MHCSLLGRCIIYEEGMSNRTKGKKVLSPKTEVGRPKRTLKEIPSSVFRLQTFISLSNNNTSKPTGKK